MSSLPPTTPVGAQTSGPPTQATATDPNDPTTWGQNREQAPEDIQAALRQLVYQFELENTEARILQIKTLLKAREFFLGRQVIYWSERDFAYKQPTRDEVGEEDFQDIELVTNIYQGYCLIMMAELSQSPPKTAFMPAKASSQADVRLAQSGSDIVGYVNRNNRIDFKLAYECWLLFNDGAYAEYWRFVRDAAKYGVETYQDTDEAQPLVDKELAPAGGRCATCGDMVPAEAPEAVPPMCPSCGEPMGPAAFQPPQTAQVPNIVTKTRPAGQEVCDVVGMLEMALPAYEKNEEELGFITWCREVHKGKLKALFPQAAEKISAELGSNVMTSAQERRARMSLLTGSQWARYGDGRQNLVTFRETWLQPWTFQMAEPKEMVDRLTQAYPSGAYVAFAGDVYCASRDEDGRKHWTLVHCYPGDGQYRQAIGSAAIATQRKFNQVDAIERETYERTIPITLIDTDVFDANALRDGRAEPGAILGGLGRGNKTIQNSFAETKPGEVSAQLLAYKERQMKLTEHQTGSLPALFGGELGGNDTARGIAIERNAAKGRVGLIYRALKEGRARADLKNIAIFRDNRTEDVEISVTGFGSSFKAQTITLNDIKEGSVKVKEETDESFPVSLNEQKNVLLQLLVNQNPTVMAWFNDPANEEALAQVIGVIESLNLPGVDARAKCYDVIELLLQSGPVQPPTPMANPAMPFVPPVPPRPSIEPDPVLDDLGIFIKTCREWAASDAGRQQMRENAAGYENVKAFAAACMAIMTPPPMPAPPAPNGGPGGQPKPQSTLPQPDAGAPGPM